MKKIVIISTVLVLSACAVEKTPVPTGGSKSDGMVELSYQYGGFEVPNVDWATAQPAAQARCKAWGYKNADPFEGTVNQCNASDIYGNCTNFTVTRTYQCTG